MNIFATKTLLYALNCYVAAMLALAIAFAFNLTNPFWAALTVYITSQPLSAVVGAVWGRAFYRLVGTVVALAMAVLIIPNFADVPALLVAVLAVWVALCTYLSLLDRSPRSYAFMLAGYTTVLVGLPVIADPSRIFDTAVARTEEIAVGVLCAAIVQSLLFPRHAGDLLRVKLRAALVEARELIAITLEQRAAAASGDRRKLAVDLSELHALSDNLRFENASAGNTAAVVRALEEDLVALLPLLSAVADRLLVLAAHGPLPSVISSLVADIRTWAATGTHTDPARASELMAACRAATPSLGPDASWSDILTANLVMQLEELVRAWDHSLSLSEAVLAPGPDRSWSRVDHGFAKARTLHVDAGLAAYTGLVTGLAMAATATYAMVIGWSQGAAAVGITAAACMVFAVADDPTPAQKLLVLLTLVAVPLAAFYQLAVFPAINGFPMLAFVLFPLLMLTGLLMGTPKLALPGLGFAIVTQTLITIQPSAQGDLVSVVNLGVAVACGALCALWVTRLIRVVSPSIAVGRIQRAGWRDIGRLALGTLPLGRQAWASLMLDREGLLQPRLARAAKEGKPLSADALRDLRAGIHVIGLRTAMKDATASQRSALDRLLEALGTYYGALGHGMKPADPQDLLERIDHAIRALLRGPRRDAHDRAVIASVGIRRNLFPTAADFQPHEARA